MQEILLIEDSPEMQILIRGILGPVNQVACASTGAEAIELAARRRFDLILLDIGLPDTDGFSIFNKLAAQGLQQGAPILFLTGKADIDAKLKGFELGAEDYIVKPFDPRELRARVDARLLSQRRRAKLDDTLRKGELVLDLSFQKAFALLEGAQSDLGLTPNEFRILYLLIKSEGRALSRGEILSSVWGSQTHVLERTIDTHVYTLRRKLGDSARLIQSVPGKGYSFAE